MFRRVFAYYFLVLSLIYWAVVIGSVVANGFIPSFEEAAASGTLSHGCFSTSAMLVYVECRGFYGQQLASLVLSLPFIFVQLAHFILGANSAIEYLVFILLAMLFLGPLVYPLFYRALRGRTT